MAVTPEEQAEIDKLREKIIKSKVDTFEYLRSMVDASDDMIRASGYKSREDALIKIMKRRMQEHESWIRAHEKKWPDK
jgi:hypothetical protein